MNYTSIVRRARGIANQIANLMRSLDVSPDVTITTLITAFMPNRLHFLVILRAKVLDTGDTNSVLCMEEHLRPYLSVLNF